MLIPVAVRGDTRTRCEIDSGHVPVHQDRSRKLTERTLPVARVVVSVCEQCDSALPRESWSTYRDSSTYVKTTSTEASWVPDPDGVESEKDDASGQRTASGHGSGLSTTGIPWDFSVGQ